MSNSILIARLRSAVGRIHSIESSVDDLVSENSELVLHVAENWTNALNPGFWKKLLEIRAKDLRTRKLASKCLRAILSAHSTFVMDVQTVKNGRDRVQGKVVTFADEDIVKLYHTIIALRHDPDLRQ